MADETKKVILQLQIDQAQSITQIAALKTQITNLKAAQKDLNTSTVEGQKDSIAYTAQISALTKEQRSLENAVTQSAAGFQFETGSIAANRAELSKLTAEYKNLAAPTADQTAKIKTLSDTLKAQESAIGNNTRNVGNYSEAFAGLSQQLGGFSPQISALVKGFSGMQSTLGTVAKGFTTLKGAIIGTGIGALLLLLGSLISYFKTTDEGANALAGIFGAIGIVTSKITGLFVQLGSALISVSKGVTSVSEVFSNIGKVLSDQITVRIKAFITTFEALSDIVDNGNISENLDKIGKAQVDLITGIEGSGEAVVKWTNEAALAAKQAYDYAIAVDSLDDKQRALNVTNAKSDQVVQQLIISAKNRTLTDQERIDLLLKANTIEEQSFTKQQQIDKARLELVKARNLTEQETINAKLADDLKDVKSEEDKIAIRQKALNINDQLNQEEADLQKKVIDGETQYILLKEKNQNKIDVFNDKIAADREKAYQAYLKQLSDINNAELTLEDQRQAQILKGIQYEESLIGKSDSDQIKNLKALGASKIEIEQAQADERVALLQQIAEQEIAIEKKLSNDKLAALTSEGLAEDANQKEIEIKKQTVIEDANAKRIQIEKQLGDQIEAINQKTNDDIAKSDADALAKKKSNTEKTLNTIGQTLNNFAQVASQANQDHLNAELADDEAARATALQQAGNDATKQAAINKKYNDLEAAQKKKAAKTDLDLKEVQAIANVALGVSQAIAEGGLAGIITGALVAAAGAIQIADIESQKSKLAKGGLLNGPSHNYGGITGTGRFNNIEVEGGEFVMNKYSTKKFLPLLHTLNSSAPNRPPISFGKMAAGGQIYDGGLSARQSLQDVNSNLNARNLIMDAITRQPAPVVLVKDINNGQSRNIIVKDRANVTG